MFGGGFGFPVMERVGFGPLILPHEGLYLEGRICLMGTTETLSPYEAIPNGSELLVYYGDSYARELSIDPQTFRKALPAPPIAASSEAMSEMYEWAMVSFSVSSTI